MAEKGGVGGFWGLWGLGRGRPRTKISAAAIATAKRSERFFSSPFSTVKTGLKMTYLPPVYSIVARGAGHCSQTVAKRMGGGGQPRMPRKPRNCRQPLSDMGWLTQVDASGRGPERIPKQRDGVRMFFPAPDGYLYIRHQ